tara:strand:+ start:257 stop:430 length:174 start_codon:yes stop_codon:yes gene_type:complete
MTKKTKVVKLTTKQKLIEKIKLDSDFENMLEADQFYFDRMLKEKCTERFLTLIGYKL